MPTLPQGSHFAPRHWQSPRFTAREAIASGQLEALPEWSRGKVPLFVVYPSNRHLGNEICEFVDRLIKLLADANLNEL